jgi:hypothetical protein
VSIDHTSLDEALTHLKLPAIQREASKGATLETINAQLAALSTTGRCELKIARSWATMLELG